MLFRVRTKGLLNTTRRKGRRVRGRTLGESCAVAVAQGGRVAVSAALGGGHKSMTSPIISTAAMLYSASFTSGGLAGPILLLDGPADGVARTSRRGQVITKSG